MVDGHKLNELILAFTQVTKLPFKNHLSTDLYFQKWNI